MSEDKQVMDMVNEHAERIKMEEMAINADYIRTGRLMNDEHVAKPKGIATPMCALVRNYSDLRRLLVMAIKALLWVLLGLTVLAAALGGHALIVAAVCVCLCVAAAAIQVDRHFRKR